MTVKNAPGFARDAGERALKTAIQAGAVFGVLELNAISEMFDNGDFDLPDHLLYLGPIIVTVLSAATSWLSKFRGDPATASSRRIV